jgi:hypothetical protein
MALAASATLLASCHAHIPFAFPETSCSPSVAVEPLFPWGIQLIYSITVSLWVSGENRDNVFYVCLAEQTFPTYTVLFTWLFCISQVC